jgi:hypothetical protein
MTMPPITPTTLPTQADTTDANASRPNVDQSYRTQLRGALTIPLTMPSRQDTKSWYEAMAKAWGQALDRQAQEITQLSDQISVGGNDQPSQVTLLTAESMRFSYLATNASTATTSVGEALQTLGRKQ